MTNYLHITSSTQVPVPGGKLIEELVGLASTGTDRFSLAHMVAPPQWSEPPQTPSFGELTIMIRGRLQVEINEKEIVLEAGHALWTEAGTTVHYHNPFDAECEYYALCLPAFSPERVHREE